MANMRQLSMKNKNFIPANIKTNVEQIKLATGLQKLACSQKQ
jgi:hypothetical protein